MGLGKHASWTHRHVPSVGARAPTLGCPSRCALLPRPPPPPPPAPRPPRAPPQSPPLCAHRLGGAPLDPLHAQHLRGCFEGLQLRILSDGFLVKARQVWMGGFGAGGEGLVWTGPKGLEARALGDVWPAVRPRRYATMRRARLVAVPLALPWLLPAPCCELCVAHSMPPARAPSLPPR